MYRIPYYLTGHTSKGLVNFLSYENLDGIEQICVLEHVSRFVKTNIFEACIDAVSEADDCEIILSPDGNEYLEGVIFRNRSFAVLSDTIADSAGLPTRILNKTKRIDLSKHFSESENAMEDIRLLRGVCRKAYDSLDKGLAIHDELESIFGNEMDFEKADEVAETLVDLLLGKVTDRQREPLVKRRMFGTNTPDGIVNIVPEILGRTACVHFIHGRAGTGKSTLMKYIANACLEKGLDLEYYHCSFDPESIDMVRVPELDYAIFDATDPHAFDPEPDNPQQEVIDTYALFVKPGTDELHADSIEAVTNRYKSKAKEGIEWLKEAGAIISRLEAPYQTEEYKKLIQKEAPKIAEVITDCPEEY